MKKTRVGVPEKKRFKSVWIKVLYKNYMCYPKTVYLATYIKTSVSSNRKYFIVYELYNSIDLAAYQMVYHTGTYPVTPLEGPFTMRCYSDSIKKTFKFILLTKVVTKLCW